jgi:hypothetical protein
MNCINPDWTCDERNRNESNILIIKETDTKTIFNLQANGWRVIWIAGGKIALRN